MISRFRCSQGRCKILLNCWEFCYFLLQRKAVRA
nr:MAG TPA: hypothetical protein [Caudoviricetes sp.]